MRQVTAYMWLGTCAKEDFFRYAGLRRRNIWPCATPMRQEKTAACAGISGVMYMDSRLGILSVCSVYASLLLGKFCICKYSNFIRMLDFASYYFVFLESYVAGIEVFVKRTVPLLKGPRNIFSFIIFEIFVANDKLLLWNHIKILIRSVYYLSMKNRNGPKK